MCKNEFNVSMQTIINILQHTLYYFFDSKFPSTEARIAQALIRHPKYRHTDLMRNLGYSDVNKIGVYIDRMVKMGYIEYNKKQNILSVTEEGQKNYKTLYLKSKRVVQFLYATMEPDDAKRFKKAVRAIDEVFSPLDQNSDCEAIYDLYSVYTRIVTTFYSTKNEKTKLLILHYLNKIPVLTKKEMNILVINPKSIIKSLSEEGLIMSELHNLSITDKGREYLLIAEKEQQRKLDALIDNSTQSQINIAIQAIITINEMAQTYILPENPISARLLK